MAGAATAKGARRRQCGSGAWRGGCALPRSPRARQRLRPGTPGRPGRPPSPNARATRSRCVPSSGRAALIQASWVKTGAGGVLAGGPPAARAGASTTPSSTSAGSQASTAGSAPPAAPTSDGCHQGPPCRTWRSKRCPCERVTLGDAGAMRRHTARVPICMSTSARPR